MTKKIAPFVIVGAMLLGACDGFPQAVPTPRPNTGATAPTPKTGAWTFHRETDPMTDRIIIAVGLESSTYSPGTGEASLFIACVYGDNRRRSLIAGIDWDAYIDKDNAEVTIRFGSNPALLKTWDITDEGNVTNVSATASGRLFVSDLRNHRKFAAQVKRYDGSSITATWDVSGLSEALVPLLQHCAI